MLSFIIALILLSISFLTVVLEKAYFYVPYRELKRQAAHRDMVARTLYAAAAYGGELRLLLFTVIGVSAAGGFVLFARVAPPLLGFVVIGLALLLAYVWLPRTRLTRMGAQLAIWCTPVIVKLLRITHPVSHRLVAALRRYHAYNHTGVYEKEDMHALIERQKHQTDSRMGEQELALMQRVLKFGDYRVLDSVVPKRNVKAVSADDEIGPVFLAELHAAGHPRFPVYEGNVSNIIGTLPIDMVADVRSHGKVRDNFDHHVAYVHEEDSLEQALRAFYETRQHLFIVVNKMGEYVGIITLSDILRKLFGAVEHEAFGKYEDREAVTRRHDHGAKQKGTTEKPTEVVE